MRTENLSIIQSVPYLLNALTRHDTESQESGTVGLIVRGSSVPPASELRPTQIRSNFSIFIEQV